MGRIIVTPVCLLLVFSAGWFSSRVFDQSGGNAQPDAVAGPNAAEPNIGILGEVSDSVAAPRSDTAVIALPRIIPNVRDLAETANISSEFLQSAALYTLAAPMDAGGIRALLGEAKQALKESDYLGGTSLLIGRYAELDFSGALDYAFENAGTALDNWLHAIFHARARLDVEEAVARAAELTSSQQHVAGATILRSNSDLTRAERRLVIETLKLPGQMVVAGQHNIVDAWNEAVNISDPMQRAGVQSQVLIRWARSDPWAALQASEELAGGPMRQAMQGQILGLAAANNSQRVIDWLNAQPEGDNRKQLVTTLVAQLGGTDPEGAQAMLEQLPLADRMQAEAGLWTRRAIADPEGAAAWVESLVGGENQATANPMAQSAPAQILMTLGMTSTNSAERFMDALPASSREKLGPTYVFTLARKDPRAASRWVEQQSGGDAKQLYSALGQSWARQDIGGAQEYALNMGSVRERDQMLTGILNSGSLGSDDAQPLLDKIVNLKLRSQAEAMINMRRKRM